MTSIGQTIRYYRLMAGWSQAKLAEVAGVSVISVRRYEEETGEQTIKTLRKIADALGVPLTELLYTSKPLAERSTIRVQKDKPREGFAPETQNWVYLDLPKLNEARFRKGLSQQQIAERTGLSRYTVNKAFFGRRIRSTTADKIERVVLDE